MAQMRLHKFMAHCGAGSRRECEEYIAQGRVEVDGQIVTTPGTMVDDRTQSVRCDAQPLELPRLVYLLLNKPRGVICSTRSSGGRPQALDFVPDDLKHLRLFTIGRLDVDSEGALILTNDGELCHRLTHPSYEVRKTYRVEIDGTPDDATMARMRKGVWLAEGRTGSLAIRTLARRRGRTVLDVSLNEGMKREIRRVCARFGHEVRRLQRVAIGPVRLEGQPVGSVRELTPEEVASLESSAEVVIKLGSSPAGGQRGRGGIRGNARSRDGVGSDHFVPRKEAAARGEPSEERRAGARKGKAGGRKGGNDKHPTRGGRRAGGSTRGAAGGRGRGAGGGKGRRQGGPASRQGGRGGRR